MSTPIRQKSKRTGIIVTIAAVFAGAEGVLPLFPDLMPKYVFAALSFISIAGALVSHFWLVEETGDGLE